MMMDTQSVALLAMPAKNALKRQHRTIAEKRQIVEETLREGTSVSRVARAHDVNANQLFYWRKLYEKGRLGNQVPAKLLPVRVAGETSLLGPATAHQQTSSSSFTSATIQIELRDAQVRIEGSIDPVWLRVLLECLRR